MPSSKIALKGKYWKEADCWYAEIAPLHLKSQAPGPYACLQQMQNIIKQKIADPTVACGIASEDGGVFYLTGSTDLGFVSMLASLLVEADNYELTDNWFIVAEGGKKS